MAGTVGIAIHRRAASLAILEKNRDQSRVIFQSTQPRAPGTDPALVLSALLDAVPAESRACPVHVALSPSDLACADVWPSDPAIKPSAQSKIIPALCEARCAGETLEMLVVDAVTDGPRIRAISLDRVLLGRLTEAAGKRLHLVTSLPDAVGSAWERAVITFGGERVEISEESRRSMPVDDADDPGMLPWNGLEVPIALAGAVAAASAGLEAVPNAMNAAREERGSLLRRLRDPLVNVAAALVLCLAAVAVHFHREAERERTATATAVAREMEFWERYLPSEVPREGRLLRSMQARLDDLGEGADVAEFPSALAFWTEIGRQMPDADALGLALESLDLAPDGGRISARLPATQDDPLRNATQLEGRLNQSKKVTTRGDYEVREGQVQVRLRMSYRP